MPTLSDKLKALGVKIGTGDVAPKKRDDHAIDLIVNGSYVSTPRGDAFVAEQAFARDYSHGADSSLFSFLFSSAAPLALIAQWSKDPRMTALAFPEGDLSFMHAIPPIGTKFHAASAYGPESQLNIVNGRTGTYTGTLHFAFGPADRK